MSIQSIDRAAEIISLFSSAQTYLGITEIATALKMNKGTVWSLVTTLEKHHFLEQDPETRKYTIGAKLFELGMLYYSSLEINARASRPLHRLASRTHCSARVGIWQGDTVLITLLALPKAADSLSHQVGPRLPAFCSGVGKAMLAFLPAEQLEQYLDRVKLVPLTKTTIVTREELLAELERTRERGYSIVREEMVPGAAVIGAPVFGRNKKLVGAISLNQTPKFMLGERLEALAAELLRAAAEISREMGYNVGAELSHYANASA
jgi:DNA-binding IclR family transcriptional regulator